MVKSGMIMLTVREKTDLGDANVVVGLMLQLVTRVVLSERERKNWHNINESVTKQPLEPARPTRW
jgi:hypothetical protein